MTDIDNIWEVLHTQMSSPSSAPDTTQDIIKNIQSLIDTGFDINSFYSNGHSVLSHACATSNEEILEYLFNQCPVDIDIEQKDPIQHRTPLHYIVTSTPCTHQTYKCFKLLLTQKPHLESVDYFGVNALGNLLLSHQQFNPFHVKMVKKLLKYSSLSPLFNVKLSRTVFLKTHWPSVIGSDDPGARPFAVPVYLTDRSTGYLFTQYPVDSYYKTIVPSSIQADTTMLIDSVTPYYFLFQNESQHDYSYYLQILQLLMKYYDITMRFTLSVRNLFYPPLMFLFQQRHPSVEVIEYLFHPSHNCRYVDGYSTRFTRPEPYLHPISLSETLSALPQKFHPAIQLLIYADVNNTPELFTIFYLVAATSEKPPSIDSILYSRDHGYTEDELAIFRELRGLDRHEAKLKQRRSTLGRTRSLSVLSQGVSNAALAAANGGAQGDANGNDAAARLAQHTHLALLDFLYTNHLRYIEIRIAKDALKYCFIRNPYLHSSDISLQFQLILSLLLPEAKMIHANPLMYLMRNIYKQFSIELFQYLLHINPRWVNDTYVLVREPVTLTRPLISSLHWFFQFIYHPDQLVMLTPLLPVLPFYIESTPTIQAIAQLHVGSDNSTSLAVTDDDSVAKDDGKQQQSPNTPDGRRERSKSVTSAVCVGGVYPKQPNLVFAMLTNFSLPLTLFKHLLSILLANGMPLERLLADGLLFLTTPSIHINSTFMNYDNCIYLFDFIFNASMEPNPSLSSSAAYVAFASPTTSQSLTAILLSFQHPLRAFFRNANLSQDNQSAIILLELFLTNHFNIFSFASYDHLRSQVSSDYVQYIQRIRDHVVPFDQFPSISYHTPLPMAKQLSPGVELLANYTPEYMLQLKKSEVIVEPKTDTGTTPQGNAAPQVVPSAYVKGSAQPGSSNGSTTGSAAPVITLPPKGPTSKTQPQEQPVDPLESRDSLNLMTPSSPAATLRESQSGMSTPRDSFNGIDLRSTISGGAVQRQRRKSVANSPTVQHGGDHGKDDDDDDDDDDDVYPEDGNTAYVSPLSQRRGVNTSQLPSSSPQQGTTGLLSSTSTSSISLVYSQAKTTRVPRDQSFRSTATNDDLLRGSSILGTSMSSASSFSGPNGRMSSATSDDRDEDEYGRLLIHIPLRTLRLIDACRVSQNDFVLSRFGHSYSEEGYFKVASYTNSKFYTTYKLTLDLLQKKSHSCFVVPETTEMTSVQSTLTSGGLSPTAGDHSMASASAADTADTRTITNSTSSVTSGSKNVNNGGGDPSAAAASKTVRHIEWMVSDHAQFPIRALFTNVFTIFTDVMVQASKPPGVFRSLSLPVSQSTASMSAPTPSPHTPYFRYTLTPVGETSPFSCELRDRLEARRVRFSQYDRSRLTKTEGDQIREFFNELFHNSTFRSGPFLQHFFLLIFPSMSIESYLLYSGFKYVVNMLLEYLLLPVKQEHRPIQNEMLATFLEYLTQVLLHAIDGTISPTGGNPSDFILRLIKFDRNDGYKAVIQDVLPKLSSKRSAKSSDPAPGSLQTTPSNDGKKPLKPSKFQQQQQQQQQQGKGSGPCAIAQPAYASTEEGDQFSSSSPDTKQRQISGTPSNEGNAHTPRTTGRQLSVSGQDAAGGNTASQETSVTQVSQFSYSGNSSSHHHQQHGGVQPEIDLIIPSLNETHSMSRALRINRRGSESTRGSYTPQFEGQPGGSTPLVSSRANGSDTHTLQIPLTDTHNRHHRSHSHQFQQHSDDLALIMGNSSILQGQRQFTPSTSAISGATASVSFQPLSLDPSRDQKHLASSSSSSLPHDAVHRVTNGGLTHVNPTAAFDCPVLAPIGGLDHGGVHMPSDTSAPPSLASTSFHPQPTPSIISALTPLHPPPEGGLQQSSFTMPLQPQQSNKSKRRAYYTFHFGDLQFTVTNLLATPIPYDESTLITLNILASSLDILFFIDDRVLYYDDVLDGSMNNYLCNILAFSQFQPITPLYTTVITKTTLFWNHRLKTYLRYCKDETLIPSVIMFCLRDAHQRDVETDAKIIQEDLEHRIKYRSEDADYIKTVQSNIVTTHLHVLFSYCRQVNDELVKITRLIMNLPFFQLNTRVNGIKSYRFIHYLKQEEYANYCRQYNSAISDDKTSGHGNSTPSARGQHASDADSSVITTTLGGTTQAGGGGKAIAIYNPNVNFLSPIIDELTQSDDFITSLEILFRNTRMGHTYAHVEILKSYLAVNSSFAFYRTHYYETMFSALLCHHMPLNRFTVDCLELSLVPRFYHPFNRLDFETGETANEQLRSMHLTQYTILYQLFRIRTHGISHTLLELLELILPVTVSGSALVNHFTNNPTNPSRIPFLFQSLLFGSSYLPSLPINKAFGNRLLNRLLAWGISDEFHPVPTIKRGSSSSSLSAGLSATGVGQVLSSSSILMSVLKLRYNYNVSDRITDQDIIQQLAILASSPIFRCRGLKLTQAFHCNNPNILKMLSIFPSEAAYHDTIRLFSTYASFKTLATSNVHSSVLDAVIHHLNGDVFKHLFGTVFATHHDIPSAVKYWLVLIGFHRLVGSALELENHQGSPDTEAEAASDVTRDMKPGEDPQSQSEPSQPQPAASPAEVEDEGKQTKDNDDSNDANQTSPMVTTTNSTTPISSSSHTADTTTTTQNESQSDRVVFPALPEHTRSLILYRYQLHHESLVSRGVQAETYPEVLREVFKAPVLQQSVIPQLPVPFSALGRCLLDFTAVESLPNRSPYSKGTDGTTGILWYIFNYVTDPSHDDILTLLTHCKGVSVTTHNKEKQDLCMMAILRQISEPVVIQLIDMIGVATVVAHRDAAGRSIFDYLYALSANPSCDRYGVSIFTHLTTTAAAQGLDLTSATEHRLDAVFQEYQTVVIKAAEKEYSISSLAPDARRNVPIVESLDAEPKKKGFFARLFGCGSTSGLE